MENKIKRCDFCGWPVRELMKAGAHDICLACVAKEVLPTQLRGINMENKMKKENIHFYDNENFTGTPTAFEYLLNNPEATIKIDGVKYNHQETDGFWYESDQRIRNGRESSPVWKRCEANHHIFLKLLRNDFTIVEDPQKPEEKRKLEEDIESKIGEIENSLFFIKKSVEENRPCGFFGVLREEVEDLRKMIEEFAEIEKMKKEIANMIF